MSIDIEIEKQRLSQDQFIEKIKQGIRPSEMLTVYFIKSTKSENIGIYCALIPNDQIASSLSNTSWELAPGEGLPGAVKYQKSGEWNTKYLRFGDDSGVEPLILYRSFNGLKEDHTEISEEFRLFHKLYHDRKTDQYIKFDDAGIEHIVAVVKPDCIQIRLIEIKQFLAIKEMHLAVFFDCKVHSEIRLQKFDIEEGPAVQNSEDLLIYNLSYGDNGGILGMCAFSRLLAKYLITPFPKDKSGFWGFAADEPKKFIDFIIDVDEDGDNVLHTSNPKELASVYDKKTSSPNYLTPVFFRLEVLDKYFGQSSKFSVGDGYLRCGSQWGMEIDNHHDDKVVAFLGDLGQYMPYEDQLHWKSYNIQPCGTISETTFRRSFLVEATDSDRPEHIFSQMYQMLQEDSPEILGWPILLPLDKGDEHYFQAIRIPSDDEQKDFDELVQALAKVLIDSLNEKKLNTLIPKGERVSLKGSISRLEKAFEENGVKDYETHIKFLRDLQDLRSTGSAHRKGSKYRETAEKFDLNNQSLRSVFQGILEKSIEVLHFLDMVVQNGYFQSNKDLGGTQ